MLSCPFSGHGGGRWREWLLSSLWLSAREHLLGNTRALLTVIKPGQFSPGDNVEDEVIGGVDVQVVVWKKLPRWDQSQSRAANTAGNVSKTPW